jgi:hypothetical protein
MMAAATFIGNYDENHKYVQGDFVYFPDEKKSKIFNGIQWEEPINVTSLDMPSLGPQEILRLQEILKEKYPEDYI